MKQTILLVEDDDVIRALSGEILEALGYELICVESAELALTHIHNPSLAIDLMLTDLNLPELSGQQLVEQALVVRPRLPVLIVSGYIPLGGINHLEVKLSGTTLSRNIQMIGKPFSLELIREKVYELIGKPEVFNSP